ncbi:MAG TPA: FAD-binding oxidoreductase [Tahibacter sp.]|uniref:NAD(P)/FAD-dependent oxidoreductase n=1 Tax=Tahibacter sp. TaxID=2056211 RepID=UPI002B8AD0D8|nr:FAD-binding oxidoreductase [Tahibacter sp.]HSX59167.1 FAD-binding oxidoreductase [Tahibacter sp.]
MKTDVLVVGGGIVGCAIAERLARDGVAVCLVERDTLGGAATAASMGHLVVLDDDPEELSLSAYSCARWSAFAGALPAAAEYRRIGTLWIARNDAELAEAERKRERLASAGIASEPVSAAQLRLLEPALTPTLAGGLHVPGDAVVYPPVAATWFAQRAAAAGAQIRCGVGVAAIGDRDVLLADGSRIAARDIVVANGCAAPELLAGVPVRKRKGHLLVTTRAQPGVRHQLVELGYMQSAHGTNTESVAFNVQPRPTGQLLLGSTRQFDDHATDVTPRLLQRLIARATEFLPGLAQMTALRAWTGFRPTTPDHRPLIGAWPLRPGVWLACGHEGLGVTTALGTADLLAAQLLGTSLPFDARPYAPSRFVATSEVSHAH